jgi:hypothetical protein
MGSSPGLFEIILPDSTSTSWIRFDTSNTGAIRFSHVENAAFIGTLFYPKPKGHILINTSSFEEKA